MGNLDIHHHHDVVPGIVLLGYKLHCHHLCNPDHQHLLLHLVVVWAGEGWGQQLVHLVSVHTVQQLLFFLHLAVWQYLHQCRTHSAWHYQHSWPWIKIWISLKAKCLTSTSCDNSLLLSHTNSLLDAGYATILWPSTHVRPVPGLYWRPSQILLLDLSHC